MLPSQRKILELLQKKNMTAVELIRITGLSPDGLRGRISELRLQYHHDIRKKEGIYQLIVPEKQNLAEEILSFVRKNRLDRTKITHSSLMEQFYVSKEELDAALFELYKQDKLLQVSKEVSIIFL